MYSIKKHFKFEASHRLMCMKEGHPCRNLHGHSYVVFVEIKVDGMENLENPNMIIDFSKLKSFQKWLDENYDHALILNPADKLYDVMKSFDEEMKVCTIPNGDPTAENMAVFFTDIVDTIANPYVSGKVNKYIITVEVFETVGNSASFTKEFY
jgi:6-pyruvoyltetrahydropterin/6-carboxytetrahydropterin synthase